MERSNNKNIMHSNTSTKTASKGPKLQLARRISHEKKYAPDSVAVVGLGYVGLPLLLLSQRKGYAIGGIDVDTKKLERIKAGSVPDLDHGLEAELHKKPLNLSDRFSIITDHEIVIICVPTPVDESHVPDLTLLREACRSIGKNMTEGQLIILESTVHPGTSEEIVIPILEKESGLKSGIDFDFAHCPERINPGDTNWPINKIPRVIGGTTDEARSRAAEFYRSILGAHIHEMHTIREAEAVKMVENSFRDVNIAFVNELAMSFDMLGIDVTHVLEGAATKPFGFMLHHPGAGVGGHCIPVDPYYLIRYAKENGFTHRFLSLAREINNGMPEFTVHILEQELQEKKIPLKGATIALLGLSYKANISDLRESPAYEIWHELEAKGATVHVFDPYAKGESNVASLEDALDGASGAIIATAHKEFTSQSPRDFLKHDIQIVIDGRNCLDKESFIESDIAYRGIGR